MLKTCKVGLIVLELGLVEPCFWDVLHLSLRYLLSILALFGNPLSFVMIRNLKNYGFAELIDVPAWNHATYFWLKMIISHNGYISFHAKLWVKKSLKKDYTVMIIKVCMQTK